MKVFISWSGKKSEEVAKKLREYLPVISTEIDPWMSNADIGAGTTWNSVIKDRLRESQCCIICLTKNNLNAPWLVYEAGLVASLPEALICPYLIDMDPSDIKNSPLSDYMAKKNDRQGTWELISAINAGLKDSRRDEGPLRLVFELVWARLESEFQTLPEEPVVQSMTREDIIEAFRLALASLEEKLNKERRSNLVDHERMLSLLQSVTQEKPAETTVAPSPSEGRESSSAPVPKPSVSEEITPESYTKLIQRVFDKPVPHKEPLAKLSIFNKSFYPRKGHITTPWQPIFEATGIHPEELILRDEDGHTLLLQVDHLDPQNPSEAMLVFSTLKEVPPMKGDLSTPSSYVTIERGAAVDKDRNKLLLRIDGEKGLEKKVYLSNNRFEICLELQPEPLKDGRDFYAGSVTSARLDRLEILDAFNTQFDLMDKERRCMQLDQLKLSHRDGAWIQQAQPNLINNPYQLVSMSAGPVRASVSIASQPFDNSLRLHRLISLFNDTTYLTEEIKVVGTQQSRDIGGLCQFNARYFSYIDMGFDPYIYEAKSKNRGDKPKYFAISFESSPYQAYGFGSDVEIENVSNPHPGFPIAATEHRTFSWELAKSTAPRCLHWFYYGTKDIEARMGAVWHEVIENPLVAIFQT